MKGAWKLAATAAPLALAGWQSAGAVDITESTTEAVSTSTADSGAPADISIVSGGGVEIASGTAITIDSDNVLTNDGFIRVGAGDGFVGVEALGGVTSAITNIGEITLNDDFAGSDDDGDGDVDGAFSQGTDRVGLLVGGTGLFAGDIEQGTGGTIRVDGNDSAAVRVTSGITGALTMGGTTTVIGDNSVGVDVQGTVSQGVAISGTVTATGEGASAVRVTDTVSEGVVVSGGLSATGFRSTTRLASQENRDALDADDLLIGGPALSVEADVNGGVFIGDPDDDADTSADVFSFGSSAAVLIDATLAAADIAVTAASNGFGLTNNGQILGSGVNDGVDALALRVNGGANTATLAGGVQNNGAIQASSFGGDATAFSMGSGATVTLLDNDGTLEAATGEGDTAVEDGFSTAVALDLETGASLGQVINDGTIRAFVTDDDGNATAVRDRSNSLTLVENAGLLNAFILPSDGGEATGAANAFDASTNTIATTLRQLKREEEDADPIISGAVLFGSGADSFELLAGQATGDVSFGAGADTFLIDNGAAFNGALTDSDGQLSITVNDGSLALTSAGDVSITDATFGATSTLGVVVDTTGSVAQASTLNASGGVTFEDGASIDTRFDGLVTETVTETIVDAGTLDVQGALDSLLGETPFFYSASLSQSAGALTLTVAPKSASELGLNQNQTTALSAVTTALQNDDELGAALANQPEGADFQAAFEQFLPDYSGETLQIAQAGLDGVSGAVGTRLRALQLGDRSRRGGWIQHYAQYVDREEGDNNPGYRGSGFGFSAGYDRPVGPLYAVGVTASGQVLDYETQDGFDDSITSTGGALGAYAAGETGPIDLDAHITVGLDRYESSREVVIDDVTRTAVGDWTGYYAAGSVRASSELTAGRAYVRPMASIDYLHLEEEGYKESGGGDAVDLAVGPRDSNLINAAAVVSAGYQFGNKDVRWWAPEVRVGVRETLTYDTDSQVRFVSGDEEFILRAEDPDAGVIAGVSVAAGTPFSSFVFDYDADVRDGLMQHTGRAALRIQF